MRHLTGSQINRSGALESYAFEWASKKARKLLIDDGLATVEDLATMADADVEKLIEKYYVVIETKDEEIILVKGENMDKFKEIAIYFARRQIDEWHSDRKADDE